MQLPSSALKHSNISSLQHRRKLSLAARKHQILFLCSVTYLQLWNWTNMKKGVINAYSMWKCGVYFFSSWAKCVKIDLTVGYVKRCSITLFCILLCHIFDQQTALFLGSLSLLAFLYFVLNCHYPTEALEAFTKDTWANRSCLCQCRSLVVQWVASWVMWNDVQLTKCSSPFFQDLQLCQR